MHGQDDCQNLLVFEAFGSSLRVVETSPRWPVLSWKQLEERHLRFHPAGWGQILYCWCAPTNHGLHGRILAILSWWQWRLSTLIQMQCLNVQIKCLKLHNCRWSIHKNPISGRFLRFERISHSPFYHDNLWVPHIRCEERPKTCIACICCKMCGKNCWNAMALAWPHPESSWRRQWFDGTLDIFILPARLPVQMSGSKWSHWFHVPGENAYSWKSLDKFTLRCCIGWCWAGAYSVEGMEQMMQMVIFHIFFLIIFVTFHRRPMQMSMRGPSVWTAASEGSWKQLLIRMNIGTFSWFSSRIWSKPKCFPERSQLRKSLDMRSSNRFQGHRLSPHQRADTTACLGRLLRWFFGGWHPIAASRTGGESMFSFGSKNLERDEDGPLGSFNMCSILQSGHCAPQHPKDSHGWLSFAWPGGWSGCRWHHSFDAELSNGQRAKLQDSGIPWKIRKYTILMYLPWC